MTPPAIADDTRSPAPKFVDTARASRILREAGVDAIVATSPENVAYLSGYFCVTHWINKGTLAFVLLPAEEQDSPCAIAPALEIDAWVEAPPWFSDFRPCGTSSTTIGRKVVRPVDELSPDDRVIHDLAFGATAHPDAVEVLAQAIWDRGLSDGRIALDESALTYHARASIFARLPHADIVDGAGLLRQIRRIKTAPEIERLRLAAANAGEALRSTMDLARPGVTERDLFLHYNAQIASRGGTLTFASVSGGRRTAHPHPLATDYRLQPGDVVKYDVGGTAEFYHADIARTQVIGPPTIHQERTYRALLAGEQAAIAALRPGVRPSEVFAAAIDAVRGAGIPDYVRHHVGHGIGIEVYDPPIIQPATATSELSGIGGSDEPLEAGMVVNIETPYYALGEHGMTVEDTLLITPTGSEYLSGLERQLR
jgi:Xaa-Pro dipeptidase